MEIGGLGNNERGAQYVLIAKVVDVAAHACLVRDWNTRRDAISRRFHGNLGNQASTIHVLATKPQPLLEQPCSYRSRLCSVLHLAEKKHASRMYVLAAKSPGKSVCGRRPWDLLGQCFVRVALSSLRPVLTTASLEDFYGTLQPVQGVPTENRSE
jgi:hypothetical protein